MNREDELKLSILFIIFFDERMDKEQEYLYNLSRIGEDNE